MDINKKGLTTLVITDRRDGEFVFYVELPNFAAGQSKEGGGQTQYYSIVRGAGESFAEARRQLNARMDLPVFLGSTRALVVTDNLVMNGLEEYMYRMQNTLDYRKTLHIVTTREKPEDFLSAKPDNNISIGYSVDDTLMWLKSDGEIVLYTVSDILEFLYADYSFVLPNMDVLEDKLAYNGYTIINHGGYGGFIPLEESNGLVWLQGENIKHLYVVQYDGNTVTVEVKAVKRDISPMYSDGRISFDISFKFDSKVQYLSKKINSNEPFEARVKNGLQAQLLADIASAINMSKSYHCDYLGFHDKFRIAYPNIASQLDWESEYVNAAFNISVETELETGGMMDLEAQGTQVQ